jgi:hypothetical protein
MSAARHGGSEDDAECVARALHHGTAGGAMPYSPGMPERRVVFIGPCHTTGYPGVRPDETFPVVACRAVEAARPGLTLHVLTEPSYHPGDYPAAARRAARKRPALAVVEVAGWFAVTGARAVDLGRLPGGVRSAYDRVRHLRNISAKLRNRWPVASRLVIGVETTIAALAEGPMRPLLPRLPRTSLAEYEQLLDVAVTELRAHDVDVVVEGPGLMNAELDDPALPPDSIEQYAAVNRLARALAQRHGAPFVDHIDATPAFPGFHLPGSVRPSVAGHEAWGELLAERMLETGLV